MEIIKARKILKNKKICLIMDEILPNKNGSYEFSAKTVNLDYLKSDEFIAYAKSWNHTCYTCVAGAS